MDQTQFKDAANAAINDIVNHFNNIDSVPVLSPVEPGYLRSLIPEHPPLHGEDWSTIQSDIDSKIKPGLTQWQSPNFMAYFPASLTYPSILGEMYSAAFTAPGFNWLCSPACTELETIMMDWVANALGLPGVFLSSSENGGGGVIQNSASDSIAIMMVVARERCVRNRALSEGLTVDSPGYEDRIMELRSRLVALGSDQAHSATAKGALIAGTRYREVATSLDTNMEMTGTALAETLQRCEDDGLIPYYITLTLGSTSSCAVDRLNEITALLKKKPLWQQIWVHIDAAYAGAALILDEMQHMSKAFTNGVDSFNFNMHKWLLVSFDASCLFVRNRHDLTNALEITPSFLRNSYSDLGSVIDYRNWSISLGRRFRALKIWFVIRSYGLNGLQAHVRKGIALGNLFAELIGSRPDLFEIPTTPAFALTVFNVKPPKGAVGSPGVIYGDKQGDEISNSITREVHALLNARGEIFITSTMLCGLYVIRVVTANENMNEKHVQNAFEKIVEATEDVLRKKYV